MRNGLRLCAFAAATLSIAVVLSTRFDGLADESFAWHMCQHMVLLLLAPAFLLLARPFQLFSAFASKGTTAEFVRRTRFTHAVAHPAVALTLYIAVLWITHFSGLYEKALEREWVHLLEHGLYFTAGVIFWLPAIAPAPLRPLPFPARLLYLFVALPQGALLAFALSSARTPLYAHYALQLGAVEAVADQANAAAIMWIAGGFVLFTAMLVTFGVWAARENRAGPDLKTGDPA